MYRLTARYDELFRRPGEAKRILTQNFCGPNGRMPRPEVQVEYLRERIDQLEYYEAHKDDPPWTGDPAREAADRGRGARADAARFRRHAHRLAGLPGGRALRMLAAWPAFPLPAASAVASEHASLIEHPPARHHLQVLPGRSAVPPGEVRTYLRLFMP